MKARLLTLGPPACLLDDRELPDLAAQKSRFALLVYLAVERDVSRDQAATLFWPDSDDDRAKHALSQSLYELKRILGDDWLETPAGRLVVNEALSCDAFQFTSFLETENFDKAVSLYRGPFLDGFYLSNCKAFETWVDKQRAQYERAHRKARRQYVEQLITAGRVQEAVVAVRRWVELEPLEDEANHKLIELLARFDSRVDALNAYATYEKRLRDELEIEPLDHTRDLVANLRTDAAWSLPAPPAQTAQARKQRKQILKVGGLVALPLIALFYLGPRPGTPIENSVQLDTTQFAILPFSYAAGVKQRLFEEQLLRAALGKWKGLRVAAEFQVQAAADRLHKPIGLPEAGLIAREVKAGRFLLGNVSQFADTLHVHIALYDANEPNTVIADRTGTLPLNMQGADSVFDALVHDLLLTNEPDGKSSRYSATSRSLPARRAFDRGQDAIRDWNLAQADSAFSAATQLDQDFTEAYIWLAQVRLWSGSDNARISFIAEHALADSVSLDRRSARRARAILQFARGDLAGACDNFRQIVKSEADDFAAWYSLATCLRRDRAVVRTKGMPQTFAFRASYQEAITAYQQAFRIHPAALRAFRQDAFLPARELFYASRRQLRTGVTTDPDSQMFVSYARRSGDSIYFMPVPAAEFRVRFEKPDQIRAAVQLQRQLFREIAAGWRAVDPNSSEATEAVAISLEMLGDRRMVDTLEVAQALASSWRERNRIHTYQTLSALKYSLPDDEARLRTVSAALDSVLRSATDGANELELAAIALFKGRIAEASAWAQRAAVSHAAQNGTNSGQLDAAAAHAQIYAALGVSPGAIRGALNEFGSMVQTLDDSNGAYYRNQVLVRASLMAWPNDGVESRRRMLGAAKHPLLAAQRLIEQGSVGRAIDTLRMMRENRAAALVDAEDVSFDLLVVEAECWFAAGQPAEALRILLPILAKLNSRPPRSFSDPVQVAALLRSMVYVVELANALHDDATAARWARALLTLWSRPDPVLRPTVKRLKAIASKT